MTRTSSAANVTIDTSSCSIVATSPAAVTFTTSGSNRTLYLLEAIEYADISPPTVNAPTWSHGATVQTGTLISSTTQVSSGGSARDEMVGIWAITADNTGVNTASFTWTTANPSRALTCTVDLTATNQSNQFDVKVSSKGSNLNALTASLTANFINDAGLCMFGNAVVTSAGTISAPSGYTNLGQLLNSGQDASSDYNLAISKGANSIAYSDTAGGSGPGVLQCISIEQQVPLASNATPYVGDGLN